VSQVAELEEKIERQAAQIAKYCSLPCCGASALAGFASSSFDPSE
jgi:hypothetical protein